MTKRKSTKRALLLSALSLLMCVSMLIGSTFAWFTDSVSSNNNVIKSGNLDVELFYMNDETTDWTMVEDDTNVFKVGTYWEPGHTEVVKLKVKNAGSLALKYKLGVNIVSETGSVNVNGRGFLLSDYIFYGITDGEKDYNRETAIAAVAQDATKLNVLYGSDSIDLEAGQEAIVTMVVYMPESVDNEANYAADAAKPEIKLGINLYATQYTFESDSYGNTYDSNATYDAPSVIIREDMKNNTLANELADNTALNGYLPDGLAWNNELSIELLDVTPDSLIYNTTSSSEIEGPIAFRLPIPASYDQDYVIGTSAAARAATSNAKLYQVKGDANAKYIDVDNIALGLFTIETTVTNYVTAQSEQAYGGVDWTLYNDGTLVIGPTKGTPTPDSKAPTKRTYEVGEWREAVIYNNKGGASAIGGYPYDVKAVKSLIIEEGVTTIGSFAAQFPNLTGEVVIPSTVTYIGQEAFQKAPITKLTFAAGGTAPLCIANGAFKQTKIEEVSFPGDREYIHIHHWAFLSSPNLKRVHLTDNITKLWGGEHVDYFDNFNAQSDPSWVNDSMLFGSCAAMETVTFESEAIRDLFFAHNNGVNSYKNGAYNGDYIEAYIGLTAYNTVASAAAAAQPGDTIELVKNVTSVAVIPAGVNFDLNGYTAPNVTIK